jgi:hypothetical protein
MLCLVPSLITGLKKLTRLLSIGACEFVTLCRQLYRYCKCEVLKGFQCPLHSSLQPLFASSSADGNNLLQLLQVICDADADAHADADADDDGEDDGDDNSACICNLHVTYIQKLHRFVSVHSTDASASSKRATIFAACQTLEKVIMR